MLRRLGPTLCRQPGRLVEDEGIGILMDDHVANQLHLVFGQWFALRLSPSGPRGGGRRGRNADVLPRLHPVARQRALAGNPQLSGPRPARHDVEGDVGHVPLEPAIDADSVVLVGDNEGSKIAHAGPISGSYASRPAQNSNARACTLRISFAATGPSHNPVSPCFAAPSLRQPCPGTPSDSRTTSAARSGS